MRSLTGEELQQLNERREFLLSRGFVVATVPAWDRDRPFWYLRENTGIRASRHGPDNLYINLLTGAWKPWGQIDYLPWERGPWNELFVDEPSGQQMTMDQSAAPLACPAGADLPEELQGFLRECLSAGFEWDIEANASCSHMAGDFETGNRWARCQGELYLISTRTRVIIDGRFQNLPLSHFTGHASPVRREESSSPRVLSAERVLVQSSGKTLQKGLF